MEKKSTIKLLLLLCISATCFALASCKKNGTGVIPTPNRSVSPLPPDSALTWIKLNAPNDTITVLEEFNNIIYTASNSNTLYTSADEGATWATFKVGTPDVSISAISVFNGRIYLGTSNNGIFWSTNGGKTWVNYLAGFQDVNPFGNLVGYPVTSFAVHNNVLYASTQGNGVYMLNQASDNWSAFNNNLPQIITSYDVFKILNTNNTLVAAGGVNGTFYYYDFTAGQWVGTLIPKRGSFINEMIIDNGSIYGATTERKIIRSNDNGITWNYDALDLQQVGNALSQHPTLYTGSSKDYVLTIPQGAAGTWIQQRDRNSAIGTSWANNQQFLGGIHANAILESNQRLFLGTDEGLYLENANP